MSRVLKWNVGVDDRVHEIGSGPVVHVACQGRYDTVQVWTIEAGDSTPERRVQAFGTGQSLPGDIGPHLGSVLTMNGALVWHLFEVTA